jgi:hypothetical protein
MARHFCKFRRNFPSEWSVGEIIGVGGAKAVDSFFVIKCGEVFYTKDVSDCRPIKKPIVKKKK